MAGMSVIIHQQPATLVTDSTFDCIGTVSSFQCFPNSAIQKLLAADARAKVVDNTVRFKRSVKADRLLFKERQNHLVVLL
jgi:hypothetical protein